MEFPVHEQIAPDDVPDDRTTQVTICPACVAKDARVLAIGELGGLRVTLIMELRRVNGRLVQSWSGVSYVPDGRLLRVEDCVNEDEVWLELLAQAEGRR